MLRIRKNIYILVLIVSFFRIEPSWSISQEDLKENFTLIQKRMKKNPESIEKTFWTLHKKFSKQLCTPGTEEKFWDLFRNFRGDGHYLPKTLEGKLDRNTLYRYIPEIKKKKSWIVEQIIDLKKKKNFKAELKELKSLEKDIDTLIRYKEIYEDSNNETEKVLYKDKSKYLMIKFRKNFNDFILKVPYLTSYRFPVDHFELRENYDEVKYGQTPEQKKRANEVYFYRKIVQDGAEDPNGSSSDLFLRSMIDTLVLKFKEAPELLTEELRYDLNSAFSGLERQLKRGPQGQVRRMRVWRNKISRQISYYEDIKKNKVKVGSHYESGDQVIETSVKAKKELQDFVYSKHKEVYDFWKNEDEAYQALYVLVTTLFNEVGGIDGKEAMERRDVLQVVINRYFHPKYNFIPEHDYLYPYFTPKDFKGDWQKHPWLNVMFKEGEFSFTYYFIHGAIRVFCPDQTWAGRKLRNENLDLSIEALANFDGDFKGIRYFSRASMLGRISMDKIWSGYLPIPERAGVKIPLKRQTSLLKAYKSKNYDYLYHFTDPKQRRFKVLQIEDKTYSLDLETEKFYLYRSPHYFKYFSAE
ncbi:MAG: hypothetical protein CME60_11075 [Halobacteriovoraceae bacterium]|nr:hypothetical protein [Halobacteriovoraceae bacterium]